MHTFLSPVNEQVMGSNVSWNTASYCNVKTVILVRQATTKVKILHDKTVQCAWMRHERCSYFENTNELQNVQFNFVSKRDARDMIKNSTT
jgi:hypothetical protein